ncbi:MAG: hypothetical protein WCW68_03760 [Methanothrix sp.]
MESATYRIVDSFPLVADFILRSSINTSSLDLKDEIARIYGVKVSAQTITKWRKQLPAHKVKCLREEKSKNILNLQFVIDLLKEQVKEIEDPMMKLKYSQEIIKCVEEINLLIDEEVKDLRNSRLF